MSSSEMKSKPRSEISVTKIHVELKLDLNQVFFVKGGDGSLVPPLRCAIPIARLPHFIAQLLHENGRFSASAENQPYWYWFTLASIGGTRKPVRPSLPASWSLDKRMLFVLP